LRDWLRDNLSISQSLNLSNRNKRRKITNGMALPTLALVCERAFDWAECAGVVVAGGEDVGRVE
jgi:hypothetical protein